MFDPMPRVGAAVGSNEAQLRCHPMVHTGRCKHPALHLQYHLPGPVKHGTREAGTIYGAGCRHPSCLYSDARVR